MQVSVTFRHMDPTDALKGYAEEKIERALKKFLRTPFEAHVVLSMERYQHLCDVTVLVSGHTIKGSEKSGDMYVSIDRVSDKIERQVSRYKDKLRSHKRNHHDEELTQPEAIVAFLDREEEREEENARARAIEESQPKVHQSKTVVADPMSVDEAVVAFEGSEEPFVVFTNRETQEVSVLYRLEDGKLGLVETKPRDGR